MAKNKSKSRKGTFKSTRDISRRLGIPVKLGDKTFIPKSVGKFKADYSAIDPAELVHDAELVDLYKNSRPVKR